MTSDDMNRPADPRQSIPGPGLAGTFRCARCERFRALYGRRLQPVQGIRQYVCKGCAE